MIWEMVRNEMVAKLPHGVVIPSLDQVSISFLLTMCNLSSDDIVLTVHILSTYVR